MRDWFEDMVLPTWVGKMTLGVGTMLVGGALVYGVSAAHEVGRHELRLTLIERAQEDARTARADFGRLMGETREALSEFRGAWRGISKQLDSIEGRLKE